MAEEMIKDIVKIEQKAHKIVNDARSNCDEKIKAAYAKSNQDIEAAKERANNKRDKKLAQFNEKVSAQGDHTYKDNSWYQELDAEAKKNFPEAVKSVLDRSIEYVRS